MKAIKTKAAFVLGFEGRRLCGAAEAGGAGNLLIDVFSARYCHSHSVGSLMREALSLRLHQGLKTLVRAVREPSSHPTPLHIKQVRQGCSLQTHGGEGRGRQERSFDKDTACRRGDNKILREQEQELTLH